MPRLVDHTERRIAIIEATWRVIADRGIDRASLREIASEVGYANGAVGHYFASKDELLVAAFDHIVSQTNARIDQAIAEHNATGLAALRLFFVDALPVDQVSGLEAKVVIDFWQRARTDDAMRAVYQVSTDAWRERIATYLRQSGTVADTDIVLTTDLLLVLVTGAQVTGTLLGEGVDMALGLLDSTLARLTAGP